MERELSRYRQEIDAIDRQIIEQLARRFEVAKEIAKIKRTYDLPVVQPDRKQEVERRYIRHGEQLRLAKEFMSHLYHLIHQETCRVEDETVAHSSLEQCADVRTGVASATGTATAADTVDAVDAASIVGQGVREESSTGA